MPIAYEITPDRHPDFNKLPHHYDRDWVLDEEKSKPKQRELPDGWQKPAMVHAWAK